MDSKMGFCGLSHINIAVDDIDSAVEFYTMFLGAEPYQIFRDFKNIGFAKSAGFLDNPKDIQLAIAFLKIPGTDLTLELMQYNYPETTENIAKNPVNTISGVKHIAIKVKDVAAIFKYVANIDGITMINDNPDYRPYKIDYITPDSFTFFDETQENDVKLKLEVSNTIGNTYYFYCLDKYGVQWEFEQGHNDL